MRIKKLSLIITIILVITGTIIAAESKIQLVLGSDTAIWNGMSTSRYHCTYNPVLYTDPSENTYEVMSDAFRSQLVDSDGTPMPLTWWMMCGNIFRHATNTDCPIPNTMTMYHMKENHLEQIEKWGDELTLHYHTFKWSDYDNDGLWHWNQAEAFEECREDFDFTLCQLLLEEENFFVSFRSGWHYMDNEWQAYLNELMPFSMHNAYGSYKDDPEEPTNNNIDWRRAPDEWIPYQPSEENYQLPGGNAGWNLRSIHLRSATNPAYLDSIFARAARGISQVACFWGHLPEEDFNDNLVIIDSIAHAMSEKYDEPFQYSTAVEGMQNWLQTEDETAPQLTLNETGTDEALYIDISVSEAIFQSQPYVAVKDIYENYYKMECVRTGDLSWQTAEPLNKNNLAKIGVAVCDSVGNQALEFLEYLPDDQFLDNEDENLTEIAGDFQTTALSAWGNNSKVTYLSDIDTAVVAYDLDISKSTYYNLFYQIPGLQNLAGNYIFQIRSNEELIKEVVFDSLPDTDTWQYITTLQLDESADNRLFIKVPAENQADKIAVFDVLKVSPLVREYDLDSDFSRIDFGDISINIPTDKIITLQNKGYKALQITDIYSREGLFEVTHTPWSIPAMGSADIALTLYSESLGEFRDTLVIASNDPAEPVSKIPVIANVRSYFQELDNEDDAHYKEFGEWHTSVTQVYGTSSRYSWLNQSNLASATFFTELDFQGYYELEYIVPKTVNSTNHALYTVAINEEVIDSLIIDQNEGSGGWVRIGRYNLPADTEVSIKIEDTGNNTNPQGVVLRADAVRFSLAEEGTGVNEQDIVSHTFDLAQNYPNPFNGSTTIQYNIPSKGNVRLSIYNLVGQEVDVLVNEKQSAGLYKVNWESSELSSGIYIYRLAFKDKSHSKRFILMK
ncbi:MAG: T9SS type A sorting domain-containing protein [Fidelibacterota bacterium]